MTKPLLAVYHNFPSGGGKRALMEQLTQLSKEFTIHLYTTTLVDDSLFPIEPLCDRVKKYEVEPSQIYLGWKRIRARWRQGTRMVDVGREAAAEINTGGYVAVYVLSCQVEHSPSVLRFLTIPSVYFCHEGLREYYEARPRIESLKDAFGRVLKRPELFRRMLQDRKAIRAAGLVLANSEASKKALMSWYGVNAVVCYLGVDFSVFYPRLEKVQGRETFLSVGRLNQLKGHDFVIELIGHLPEKYRMLTIAFDQDSDVERERLGSIADERGVTISFQHRISEDDLCTLYQSSFAVICGQIREPFGFIAVEAMACKGLVCAVREGGFLETVVDGVTGISVPRDPAEAAKLLLAVLEDEVRGNNIRQSAFTKVKENWSWERHAKELTAHILKGQK